MIQAFMLQISLEFVMKQLCHSQDKRINFNLSTSKSKVFAIRTQDRAFFAKNRTHDHDYR